MYLQRGFLSICGHECHGASPLALRSHRHHKHPPTALRDLHATAACVGNTPKEGLWQRRGKPMESQGHRVYLPTALCDLQLAQTLAPTYWQEQQWQRNIEALLSSYSMHTAGKAPSEPYKTLSFKYRDSQMLQLTPLLRQVLPSCFYMSPPLGRPYCSSSCSALSAVWSSLSSTPSP